MKSILISIFLLSLFLPNLISAGCSFIEPIDYFDKAKAAKIWYAVRRYANGQESNTTCQILNLSNIQSGFKTFYYADGTSKKITGETIIDPDCNTGKVVIKDMTPGNPDVFLITYVDYDNFMVIRACFNDIGLCLCFDFV